MGCSESGESSHQSPKINLKALASEAVFTSSSSAKQCAESFH